jgi:ubiquinone/menaquinone biosynthesis C-methylase UbiE
VLSESAASIVATDLNDETLAVARQRTYGAAEVTFATADAYDLAAVEGVFDVVFAGFFWSHVLRADAARFARTLTERVAAGGMVVLVDNLYVAGSSSPITRTTASGDTYQTRRLTNGRQFEVLKNFPERTDLVDAFGPELEWTDLTYFWLATAG